MLSILTKKITKQTPTYTTHKGMEFIYLRCNLEASEQAEPYMTESQGVMVSLDHRYMDVVLSM